MTSHRVKIKIIQDEEILIVAREMTEAMASQPYMINQIAVQINNIVADIEIERCQLSFKISKA